jgi:hypothetical protein
MTLDRHLGDAAAEFAKRRAAIFGKGFLDGEDDDHPPELDGASPALPTTIHLVYERSSGERTERVVTLLSAWRTDEVVYFKARCHLRRALRTFRADYVVELVCLATGEVPDDPQSWIVDHALYEGEHELDYTPHALRVCRDELAILAYVGGADGTFHENEIDVAVDHVMMSTDREIDRDLAARYISRLSPSAADLHDHIRAMARHPERWPRLTRSMRRLVDGDRVVAVEEQVAWSEISAEFEGDVRDFERARQHAAHAELANLLGSTGLMAQLELEHPVIRGIVASAVSEAATPRP